MNSNLQLRFRFAGAMRKPRPAIRFLSVLAAIALFAMESIALAHEIEHDLELHDEPSCSLHLYTASFAKVAGGEFCFTPTPVPESFDTTPTVATVHVTLALGYRGRAPPRGDSNLN